MEIIIYQVDVFTSEVFCGNPAGVITDARDLSTIEMQKIAKEINATETAFVLPLDDDLYNIRYFTPDCEIDLCGHGTIATFYTLALKGYIKPLANGIKKVYQKTNLGKFPVEIYFFNEKVEQVIIELAEPKYIRRVEDLGPVLEAMDLKESDIGLKEGYISPEIISIGIDFLILPVKSKEILDSIQIDIRKMKKISKDLNVTGIHAFYLPEKDSETVYSRNFSPVVGINEESATGTANGGLLYYLYKNNLTNKNYITSLQGESLDRPSEIYCYINKDGEEYSLKIGGKAKIVIDGIINF